MYALLTLNLFVQPDNSLSVNGGCIAKLFVEWCLIIETCSQSEGDVLIPGRYHGQRGSWRHDSLLVVAPISQTKTVVQCPKCGLPFFAASGLPAIGVLDISFYAM